MASAPPTRETSDALTLHSASGRISTIELRAVPVAIEPDDAVAAQGEKVPFWRRHFLLLALFVLPVVAAILYFGLIASDVFTSEARFIVRTSTTTDTGISALIQQQGMSRGMNETYAVAEFIESREAAAFLEREADLRGAMSRAEADIFARFPNFHSRDTWEQFYEQYKSMLTVDIDTTSGIVLLAFDGFLPDDSQRITKALVGASERFINKLNERAQADTIGFAQKLVGEAQQRLTGVETRLAEYRNRAGFLDPQEESKAALTRLGNLATDVAKLEATLAQQVALAPNSPTIEPLRERILSYKAELEQRKSEIVGGENSVATKLQEYELLTLERELAAKWLATAVEGLEKARQEAQSQRVYLQLISEPNFADQPSQPYRVLSILAVLVLAFAVYRIVVSLVQTIKEHQP